MARNLNKNRVFRFNRRIRGQTDYSQRLRLLKSKLTRIVVRRSNAGMTVQFVEYAQKGDKILTSARAIDLKKLGFELNTGNQVAAYLTGMLAGKRLLKTKFDGECIVDLGLQNASFKGSRIYAAVKGVADSGVKVRVSDSAFPEESRLTGEHLSNDKASSIVEKTKKKIEAL